MKVANQRSARAGFKLIWPILSQWVPHL